MSKNWVINELLLNKNSKQLEEKPIIKNYALDASPVAIGLADLNGNIFYVNDAFVKLWGRYLTKNEAIEKHVSKFITSPEQLERIFKKIVQGEIYNGEVLSTRPDGSKFYSIFSASLTKADNKLLCIYFVFFDITERKQLELKLQEQTKHLAVLNKTKDKFFSILAHDLKSTKATLFLEITTNRVPGLG